MVITIRPRPPLSPLAVPGVPGPAGPIRAAGMKILRVIATLNPEWGGPMEGVRQMTRAMIAVGHRVEVACLDAPGSPWLEGLPFPVHPLGPSLGRYRYSRRLVPWLRRHAAEFDCVVVHGTWQYQSLGTWLALRKRDIPYFLYPHGALESWSLGVYPLKGLKKRAYWRLAEHRAARDARAVLFTCEEELELARDAFRPFDCNAVVVKYGTSGPDPSADAGAQRRAFLGRFPELADRRLFLFLGRIHPQKGIDLLIEAFAAEAARDPALHLVVAGPGPQELKAELARLAESRGVGSRVSWPGMLTGDLKWGAFLAAEASCLPSHFDSFGISVAESLACGTPVLISDRVGICREILADGAGLAGPPTVAGTTDCLRRWLELPESEREAMGRRARACFEDRFHVEGAVSSIIRTFEDNGVHQREAGISSLGA